MKITGLKCPSCGDIIFSRCNHDFRYCGCHDIAVDGGQYTKEDDSLGYTRVIWSPNVSPDQLVPSHLYLADVTFKELYDDWNHQIDKYGLIKNTTTEVKS